MRVSFLLVLLLLASLARAADSDLEFQPAAIAFGRQPQNQALAAAVTVTNASAVPILIKRVESDCACTTGEVFPRRLAPGASADLTVRVQTGAWEGNFRHSLFLVTNRDRQTLPVSAEVYRYHDWTITPSRAIFAPSLHGHAAALALRLEHRGPGLPDRVTATSNSPWIEVGRPRPTGQTVLFTLRKLPEAPSGSLFAELSIATQDAALPVLTVPVFAYVTALVAARPNPVLMPVVGVGAPTRAVVQITGWDGTHPLHAALSGGQVDTQDRDGVTLTLVAAAAGTTTHQLQIYDGDDLVLTVPVIERTEP
jgi:hypothetical protein